MVRVLLAGGYGFLGSHLADRLLRRRDLTELVVVDNLWTGRLCNLGHVADPRLTSVFADVETAQFDGAFDEIYHFAGPATPLQYMAEPIRTISANVGGALNLLRWLRPGGQFAYSSTSEVYGDPIISPQPESYRGLVDCTGPRASYDESKRCVEALLFEARRAHDLRVKVVRLFNVYGPRTYPGDGRAVSNFIGQAISGEPMTIYGDGQQVRSWGYVDDIMDALERYFWADGVDFCGPMNLGNDREAPVLAIAREVERLVDGSIIDFLPPVPQDPCNRCPDLTLAKAMLPGWSCKVPCEEGVARTLEWFLQAYAPTIGAGPTEAACSPLSVAFPPSLAVAAPSRA